MTEQVCQPYWESRLQTITSLAILALGIWLFTTVQNQTVAIAVQTEQIATLGNRLNQHTESAHRMTSVP